MVRHPWRRDQPKKWEKEKFVLVNCCDLVSWRGRMACLGVAGLYGRANLEKVVAEERESKGVEVEGVQLLQGERVGSQECEGSDG